MAEIRFDSVTLPASGTNIILVPNELDNGFLNLTYNNDATLSAILLAEDINDGDDFINYSL